MTSAFQKARAHIQYMADASFASHVIVVEIDTPDWKAWKCARPGSWTYGFHVVAGPCFIAVTGDIGDRIFRCSDRDAFAWLKHARDSINYMAEKCQDREPNEFSVETAEEFVAALEADPDTKLRAARIREQWNSERDAREFYEACQYAGIDDPPDCTDFDHETLWCIAALQRFCALLDQREIQESRP